MARIESENAWYSFVKRNYQNLFPNLYSRSRFNRTRQALFQTTELLRQTLFTAFAVPTDRFFIMDTFPLAVCKFGRARYCHTFCNLGADYGKCPSKKQMYFGYKVHVMVTLKEYVTAFDVTPASTDNRDGLRDLVDGQSDLVILGDKGYTGEVLAENLSRQGICLMTLKHSNSKTDWPRHERQLIFRLRRRVETVFSQLSRQLNAERVLARSFQGMCMRLVNKILVYNLCMVLNRTFGEDCELARIKNYVF